mgnify:CR=1 FL=1
MDKIIDILDSIAYEKGLKIDDVENALKEALIKTAQKMVDETLTFDANIDRANKRLELFQKIEVVSEDDERLLANAVNKYGNAINYENFIILTFLKLWEHIQTRGCLLGFLICQAQSIFIRATQTIY